MKKIKILFIIILIGTNLAIHAQLKKDTSNNVVETNQENKSSVYQLFPTQNVYTSIKLNTRNGQMWQVQWGTETKFRFVTALSTISRVNPDEEKNNRFVLYPTSNIYNFMLLDQIDGRTWQVQWGKAEDRMVIPLN
ncbi:MAG: hypothetical protein WCJ62_03210 [Flavobacterium sp.]